MCYTAYPLLLFYQSKRMFMQRSSITIFAVALCLWTATAVGWGGVSTAFGGGDTGSGTPAEWRAGCEVSAEAVRRHGVDRCFSSETISVETAKRMRNKSYKQGCAVPLADLRYLRVLHYDGEGRIKVGEMVCDKAISADLLAVFRELFAVRYPIERMVLVDNYDADDERSMAANNTTCFNYRAVAGSRRLSNHSRGRAVDVNPLYNPHVRMRQGRVSSVAPKAGQRYADRTLRHPMMINGGSVCLRVFKKHGFRWGGDWRSSKDYQHFEK